MLEIDKIQEQRKQEQEEIRSKIERITIILMVYGLMFYIITMLNITGLYFTGIPFEILLGSIAIILSMSFITAYFGISYENSFSKWDDRISELEGDE